MRGRFAPASLMISDSDLDSVIVGYSTYQLRPAAAAPTPPFLQTANAKTARRAEALVEGFRRALSALTYQSVL